MKAKLVKESLNEGKFSCKIEDLNLAINKYIKKELHFPKDAIEVKQVEDHILITYKYNITTSMEWLNMSDDEILERIKKRTLIFSNYFKRFEHFCTNGLRGMIDTFKKDTSYVTINTSCQLDKVKYKTDPKNWNDRERRVFRYSNTGVQDLAPESIYIERNGKENLNILTVTIGLFLRTI
jgi:hypothetical protein